MPAVDASSVHLFGGLPTPNVRRGLERIGDLLALQTFMEFVAAPGIDRRHVGVILPPHVETSQLVEDWEAGRFLDGRFGAGVAVGHVLALVDADRVSEQLASSEPISTYGWGRTARDTRAVADIVVGQIESASRIVLVGDARSRRASRLLLRLLNPGARMLDLDEAPPDALRDFVTHDAESDGRPEPERSARVVPPWLTLLRDGADVPRESGRFLYRRTRPFDAERFRAWLSDPPDGLVRGKGTVWIAGEPDRSFGYSCAGAVHRVFEAGRWWAAVQSMGWPEGAAHRRRLFERWHRTFGDRRQEIAFLCLDVDADAICSALDACLVSEQEALASVVGDLMTPANPSSAAVPRGAGLH